VTRASRSARVIANALDRVLGVAAPMDPTVKAGVAAAADSKAVIAAPNTVDLLNQAAALIAAMAPGSAHAESAAFLVPELQCRAAALAEQQHPNVTAALQLFPQHTR
jgi:hypothetical protein